MSRYIAKNIDTEKVLEAISESMRFYEREEQTERIKTEAYYSGIRKGLETAKSMFYCSNYEHDQQDKGEPK